jgi:hypothetical protein
MAAENDQNDADGLLRLHFGSLEASSNPDWATALPTALSSYLARPRLV